MRHPSQSLLGSVIRQLTSRESEILATLLNDGTSPITNKQILKPETVKEMFTNQIPQFPNFGRQEILPAKPELTNGPLYELYPQAENPRKAGV